jgi:Uma2 family endonuclease
MAMSETVIEQQQQRRWTRYDLELLPENGIRYEIIDGELYMAKQPHWHHQETCGNIYRELANWSEVSQRGRASINPGVLFSETDDVVPDVAWISNKRFSVLLDEAGHLTGAPELVVEVLSPGAKNEQRDRQTKLKLYERQGVQEYWIVDWRLQQVEVYRRDRGLLQLVGTLLADEEISSPLLPGFNCPIARFFSEILNN